YLHIESTTLYTKLIPMMHFFTDTHDYYHRPTDVADKLNYEGLERVTRFARSIALDLATASTRPDYVKVERSGGPGGRDALRAYLGTVPDSATEVKGVKLSGGRGGR